MTAAVGVDVGGTYVKAARCEEDGTTGGHVRRPTPPSPGEILELVGDLAASLGPGLPVGVGLAGMVDHERGDLMWGPHLPGENVAVSGPLAQRLSVEVVVDNDANLAAFGEWRQGAAAGAGTVALVTLGTGIGMGVISEGRIFRGGGYAGEVGHVTVESPGEQCACGRRGCWETKVSGRRFEADAVALLGPGHSADDLMAEARAGNAEARERVERAAGWLAHGVEALVLAVDPEVVVVGGAASLASDLLLGPIESRLAGTEGARLRNGPSVVAGILGPEAGAVGAGLYAMEVSSR